MKRELINFNDFDVEREDYKGNRKTEKLTLHYTDGKYLLKFNQKTRNSKMSYANSCHSEYIACNILRTLGLNAQKTILGFRMSKRGVDDLCVACWNFILNRENATLHDFTFIKSETQFGVTATHPNGMANPASGTELYQILETIKAQTFYSPDELTTFFWEQFAGDAFLGNTDRHNGNWGLIYDRNTKKHEIAPIYDCASSLFPHTSIMSIDDATSARSGSINYKRLRTPKSRIKVFNKIVSYSDFYSFIQNKDALNAFFRVMDRVNYRAINKIIDETPALPPENAKFLKKFLGDRKKHLVECVLAHNILGNKVYNEFLEEKEAVRLEQVAEFGDDEGMTP